MSSKKHFGQDSPGDQIRAQMGAIKGSVLNIQDGLDPMRAATQILEMLRAMESVLPHLEKVEWDPEKSKQWE